MNTLGFLLVISLLFSCFFVWAVKCLPREEWQILGTMPLKKLPSGEWIGVNFTFYGFFVASAIAVGLATFVFLAGLSKLDEGKLLAFSAFVFVFGLAASRLVAGFIEKQSNTFSVAGATFVIAMLTPLILWIVGLPVLSTLAALAVAYCFGEAIGRFACLSYGCCYGKQLTNVHPKLAKFLTRWSAVFRGELKKAAYEGHVEGLELIPVQGISSAVCFLAGIFGMALYAQGHVRLALIVAGGTSQFWRVIAETLRADLRGPAKWSRYQIMASFLTLYLSLLGTFLPVTVPEGGFVLTDGFIRIWNPGYAFLFQSLWIVSFLYYGRSTMTGSKIELMVRERG